MSSTGRRVLRAWSTTSAKTLDLEPRLGKRLGTVIEVSSRTPRYMLEALTQLRRSFVVPVPGIVVRFRQG